MRNKPLLTVLCVLALMVLVGIGIHSAQSFSGSNSGPTITTSVRFVTSTITADGSVTAQNQANLNFLTAGKLAYLPFKIGDKVYQGQTVASLDTYALRQQLQLAANAYQTTKNNIDQAMENNQAGVIEGQTRYSLDYYNKQGYAAVTEATVVYDTVQRIVDNDLLAENSAQINVDLANYAVQLASLTTPINGIVTREDVTVQGVNVTPVTTFTVEDPDSIVFRANVPTENIYYVSEGSTVTLAVDGLTNKLQGTVTRIYPSKVILPSGQAVYQVDIASTDLKKQAKLDETGTAIINTNAQNVALVPAWTVLAGKYIWVDSNGTPELKQVSVGKTHGNEIEITGGLSESDKIIIDPKFIPSQKYQLL